MIRTIARYGVRHAPGTTSEIISAWVRREFIKGNSIHEFERQFAAYHGVRNAITTSYGRMAFYYILRSLELPTGSEIIFPALTFWVIPELARVAGLRPIFVDIDPRTYNLDPRLVERALTDKTRAIVPTHLYGLPCDLNSILKIAQQNNLIVIEDCAHALGATYYGHKVGAFGEASFFSFQMLKGLNTYGGGIALTNNDELARRIRKQAEEEPWPSAGEVLRKLIASYILRWLINPYFFTFTGFLAFYIASFSGHYDLTKYIWEKIRPLSPLPDSYRRRYSNVQAKIGLHLLKHVDRMINVNIENARYLTQGLIDRPSILTPLTPPGSRHVYYQYCVRVSEPVKLSQRTIRRGIDIESMHIDVCSMLDLFSGSLAHCPVAEATTATLQLPVYSSLASRDLDKILRVIRDATASLPPVIQAVEALEARAKLKTTH